MAQFQAQRKVKDKIAFSFQHAGDEGQQQQRRPKKATASAGKEEEQEEEEDIKNHLQQKKS